MVRRANSAVTQVLKCAKVGLGWGMSCKKTAIPDDLLQLKQRLEQWRSGQPSRSRLPDTFWAEAVEMARRYGLHLTAKTLRMDYMRLKKRLSPEAECSQNVP
jgi:hypothetical protein